MLAREEHDDFKLASVGRSLGVLGHPLHAKGFLFYKPLPHPLSPSTPQGGVDGSRIPFKQMGKPRARERNETFPGLSGQWQRTIEIQPFSL